MASRDRLKDGEETRALRRFLADKLGAKDGRLWEIQKRRKDSIAVESEDAKDLLKSFAQNFSRNDGVAEVVGANFKFRPAILKVNKKEILTIQPRKNK